MKLIDSIIISLAAGLFIIGVHQTFYYGVAASYWLFMLSLFLFFYLRVIKAKRKEEENKSPKGKNEPGKSGKVKTKK